VDIVGRDEIPTTHFFEASQWPIAGALGAFVVLAHSPGSCLRK
jgi:hypothetical protein